MKAKICKNAEIIENKCKWTESRMMICNWSFMPLMLKMLKVRFLTILRVDNKIYLYKMLTTNLLQAMLVRRTE